MHHRHVVFSLALIALSQLLAAREPRDRDPAVNLALGRKVVYLPRSQQRSEIAEVALTDGVLVEQADRQVWFGDRAVRWQYPGRVNLCLDLGETQPIDEVAVRFLGFWPWDETGGICMPGWVEVMVADSLRGPYYKAAEYSKWTPGDREKYGIPRTTGEYFVFRLSFRDLRTSGRYVGIRFYSANFTFADELFVFRGEHAVADVERPAAALADFTVTDAQLYFHTPLVHVTSNIVTPLPVGCVAVESEAPKPLTIALSVPESVRIVGGHFYAVPFEKATVSLTLGRGTSVHSRGRRSTTPCWSASATARAV
jgi:hypothetical protein